MNIVNYNLQLPLAQLPRGTPCQYYLHELPTYEQINAPAPSRDLVADILCNWILTPILTCPDGDKIYILAGKRRIMSLHILEDQGLTYQGTPVGEVLIPAIFYENVDEQLAALIEFSDNHHRSDNAIADYTSIATMAQFYNLDMTTRDGLKEIAKCFHTTVQVIKSIIESAAFDQLTITAQREGRISPEAARKISKLDRSTRAEVASMLENGESVTISGIETSRKQYKQQELAGMSLPRVQVPVQGTLVVTGIVETLQLALSKQDWSIVESLITRLI
jgi:hypothetical protein